MIASIFEAFNAGKIDTRHVIKIEKKDINNIDPGFISDGIVLKKYISSGNKLILNISLKNVLKFSIYKENDIPNIIPNIVANDPILDFLNKFLSFFLWNLN